MFLSLSRQIQIYLVISKPTLVCPIKPSQYTQAKLNRQAVIKQSLYTAGPKKNGDSKP